MRKWRLVSVIVAVLLTVFLCIPVPRFDVPYSTVVSADDGELLGARIADDGQWRFPATNNYSEKYLRCVLEYEDRLFFLHCGFNPASFAQAAIDNVRAGKIKRGGSTITMQVVRLSRNGRPRTFKEKIIEVVLAMRLEVRYSKKEIFDMYAANAPFGGNVVGIDAAAWRYFNTSPDNLTWSEAAALAVLPNSPSLVNPSKGREELKRKRDNLLQRMSQARAFIPKKYGEAKMSAEDYDLSLLEAIPDKPYALPSLAYHYVCALEKNNKGKSVRSTIDYSFQKAVSDIAERHRADNSANGVENVGVYVVDYYENEVKVYVGNSLKAKDAAMVDMVRAQRSTGSVLKPFLYASSLDDGTLLPTMILPDIPINLSGYTPQNYSGDYSGAVTAEEALQKSLNTPFVYLLRRYGLPRFYKLLKDMGLSGLVFPPDHYGFSIILGGAEASLFDIVNAYAAMASKLYGGSTYEGIKIPFSREAISLTFDAMRGLTRPESQSGWRYFSSSKDVAWKTGTSFGFKDAWAIGIKGRYVVGVWCGNADGEGRPGLTGLTVAAPLLFDVINVLDDYEIENEPQSFDYLMVDVCSESGMPKSELCESWKSVRMPNIEMNTGVCPYHKKVFLDESRRYRVSADCYDIDNENFDIYFMLPPVMEWFYKKKNPLYRMSPPLFPECMSNANESVMSFVYPDESASLIIPIGIKGDRQSVVFELAHRNPEKTVFWSLNEHFLGETKNNHQMPVLAEPGSYTLRCVDEDGNDIKRDIVIKFE
ncbi:MAG: penicillin-binding protein 1C [Candidatus Limimorpha sp.]